MAEPLRQQGVAPTQPTLVPPPSESRRVCRVQKINRQPIGGWPRNRLRELLQDTRRHRLFDGLGMHDLSFRSRPRTGPRAPGASRTTGARWATWARTRSDRIRRESGTRARGLNGPLAGMIFGDRPLDRMLSFGRSLLQITDAEDRGFDSESATLLARPLRV
jgi:hypothetical protein